MVSDGGGQEPRAHLGRSGQVPEAPTHGSATLHHAYKPTHIGDEKLPVGLLLSIHILCSSTPCCRPPCSIKMQLVHNVQSNITTFQFSCHGVTEGEISSDLNSISRKIVKVIANNNRFRVT